MKILFKIIDKININILTYPFIIISCLLGQAKLILMYYYIAIVHELFHLLACKIFKIDIISFDLLPFGVSMKVDKIDNIHSLKQIIIYIAGPMSMLINMLVFSFLYRYKIINDINYNYLSKINVLMALINLFPIFPLDGYKIFNNILNNIFPYKKSLKISMIISCVFFMFFVCINFISNQFSLTLFLLFEQIKNIIGFKSIYKKFLVSKTKLVKLKKYKFIKNFQMYKDINNYQIENDKILNDFDIATSELRRYI